MLKEIYKYRELLKSNVKKEIRGKYKGSFLGILWSFINPLLMTLVYAIVFPFILRSGQPHYTTYIVIGILPWNFFTSSVTMGTYTILANAGIIKKVYFPREILPISVVTSSLVNFIISLPIILLFLIFSGIGISKYIIFLPIIVFAEYLLILGIVFITCSINVYIRDFEYIINFFIQMLFYATPIVYSSELFGSKAWLLKLNPMTIIIESYRNIFFYHSAPSFFQLGLVLLIGFSSLFLGILIFKKLEKGFAEEV